MADSPVFDWICRELDAATSLSGLEARGTVRLALKAAGLEARSLSTDHLSVLLERVLPGELESRGVDDAHRLCADLARRAEQEAPSGAAGADSPEAVFARLGG